ncbi:hypothetical protein C0992_012115 [Termitomyces sp. T32_za158]|nr:hypothetical protein C0992_012115 [Termitomyces sp. T32_za158]
MEVPGGGPTAVEGVPAPVSTPHSWPDKGKRKAISESEAPKRVRRLLSLVPSAFEGGPSGSNVFSPGLRHLLPSITVCQGLLEISRAERWEAQDQEIEQLWACLAQGQAGSSTGVPGFMALSAYEVEELAWDLHQATESESCWWEWLLHKVARTWLEVLGWAREHRLLLDGLSLGVLFVMEELARHTVTPGVAQGVGRLSRLMKAHQHWRSIEAGSWLEMFMDGLRTPPTLKETVEVAQELLELEFGLRGG